MRLSEKSKEIGIVTTSKKVLMIGINYPLKQLEVLKVIDL
jgi:hypothetical protein